LVDELRPEQINSSFNSAFGKAAHFDSDELAMGDAGGYFMSLAFDDKAFVWVEKRFWHIN
jgi:hypothetical protein